MAERGTGETEGKPWGRVAGLLTGCLVTLLGVANRLDPAVILLRAFTSAVLLAGLVRLGFAVGTRLDPGETVSPNPPPGE
jgi:hypothetical protein